MLILSEMNLSWEIIVVSNPSHQWQPRAQHWVEGTVYHRVHGWGVARLPDCMPGNLSKSPRFCRARYLAHSHAKKVIFPKNTFWGGARRDCDLPE